MKTYIIRLIIIILLLGLFNPVNNFFKRKELEFSQAKTFTFQPPLNDKFYKTYHLDKASFKIKYVVIAGGFSGWSTTDKDFVMEKVSNNTWQKSLSLNKGRNPYKYVLFPDVPGIEKFEDFNYSNGYWIEDLKADVFENDNYGGRNSIYIVRSTRVWNKIFNFIVYAVVLVLITLTLLEFAVRLLMHARLSLKSKLILILGIFLVLSNIFFIYNNYKQYSHFTKTMQIDKFNMLHNMLLGEGVDFFSLDKPATRTTITNTLNRFFHHSTLREDYSLFSNTKQQMTRLSILDPQGRPVISTLEPSQTGYLGYWLSNDQKIIDTYLRHISDNMFAAYTNSKTAQGEIFSYQTYRIFQQHPMKGVPSELQGISTLDEFKYSKDDLFLYPIYHRNQLVGKLVGYYFATINPKSFSQAFQNILVFNGVLILVLAGLFYLLINQLGEIILEPLHNVIHGINRIQEGDYDYEIQITTRDEIKTLGDSYNFMREFLAYSKRKVEHYTQHLEDIVEERTLELKVANEKLQEMDNLKSQFFANISHDLRTPLTLILAPIEFILEEELDNPEEIRNYLNTIHSNALRLLKLINNLLDFSKLEAGRLNPKFVKTDIVQILTFLVSTLKPAAERRELVISLDTDSQDSEIYVDTSMFEKIIMNLLSNAFKFTPQKGSIKITLDVNEELVYITIADTGVGIPENMLDHIFERFTQVDGGEKREFEGSGIGLSLVKELIDLHHGEISVESSQGNGASFTVSFKKGVDHLEPEFISEEHANEVISFKDYMLEDLTKEVDSNIVEKKIDKSSLPGMQGTYEQNIKGAKVLVVDDNLDMRSFIITLLKDKYDCIPARDGMEALELTREYMPDMIISDVMMPRMTGFELCAAIKSDKELKHIPVILLTAKVDMAGKLEGLSHQADDYLSKPFNTKELLVRVKNLLVSRKMEMQLFRRQKEIEQDLTQAVLVQNSILTSLSVYQSFQGLEIDVRYLPMSLTVSGDYYNISPLKNGLANITIADTAGHGLQAALTTMQLDVLVRESRIIINNPAQRLEYINKLFVNELKTRNFLTVFNLDIYKDKIVYSSAGHPEQFLLRMADNKLIPLKTKGKAIGFFEASDFHGAEQEISSGDIILLFSDGLYEEFSPQGDEFGDDRFMELISKWVQDKQLEDISMKQFNLDILDAINVYLGKEEVCDDITLIAIRIS